MRYSSDPDNLYRERFVIRTYETCKNNRVTLPSYCNFLQEAAAKHFHALGQGPSTAENIGFTWVLMRLHLIVKEYVRWRDEVTVLTWPSGVRDRTTALRDFIVEDKWGEPLLQCASEWYYLDIARMQVATLPDYCGSISSANALRADVPETSGRIPDFTSPRWESSFTVRKSDHDFNNHVNNAHYIEWILEALPKEWRDTRQVTELDISFKAGTRCGDTLHTEIVEPMDSTLLHRIKRTCDDAVLATARTLWETL
jgi:medium-chain acyl-[acyl-carrier-protein] hydrolase